MAAVTAPLLRPQGMGQLLDQAIRVYRRNFLRFIGIIALVQVPATALGMLVTLGIYWSAAAGSEGGLLSGASLAAASLLGPEWYANLAQIVFTAVIQLLLIQGVGTAALTRAVADHYLGRPGSFLDAYRRLGRGWLRLIGALLLAVVFCILILLYWFLVPCVGWLSGMGVFVLFSMVVMPLIAPVIVLEKQGVLGSIRRAWDLARRRFWWVLGFAGILYLFQVLVVAGPAYLLNVVLQLVLGIPYTGAAYAGAYVVQTVAQSLVSMALSLLYLPLQLTAITLLYVDLRVRTEGFDLLWRTEDTLREGALPADLLPQAPPPGGEALVTWKEIAYCMALSLGAVALLFFVYMALMFIVMLLFFGMAF